MDGEDHRQRERKSRRGNRDEAKSGVRKIAQRPLSKAVFDIDVKEVSASSGPTLELDFEKALREGTFKQYIANTEKDIMPATGMIMHEAGKKKPEEGEAAEKRPDKEKKPGFWDRFDRLARRD